MNKYKHQLEVEEKRLLGLLATVGEQNPEDKDDWVPTPPNSEGVEESDPIDAADAIEEYNERIGIEKPLEDQLHEVRHALEAIEKGTYGKCSVCGEKIEEGRLNANPSATTCISHMG